MKRTLWIVGWAVGVLTCAVVIAQEKGVVSEVAAEQDNGQGKKQKKTAEGVGREAVITAGKIEFDNKEGVILFDENVLVDDEQFVMRSDRLLVFMEGTNDVQQIMAVGRVSITNQNRSASCDKAVYTKKDGQIVMTGSARLMRQGDQGGEVTGKRITFWLDDERMEVSPGRVVLPPGTFNKADAKKLMP